MDNVVRTVMGPSLGLLILQSLIYSVNSQVCDTNKMIGLDPPSKKSDISEAGKNAVLLNGANKYTIDCCGYIDQWTLYARAGITTGVIIKGQVWKQGSPYTLMGENDLVVNTANSENTIDVSGNRIHVKPNYYLGFYEPTELVVTGGGGESHKKATFTGGETSFDWDSITDENSEYSINVRVQPSAEPVFTNLDSFIILDSTAAAGSSIITLAATDNDAEDAGQLVIIQTGSTGLADSMIEYDTNTQQVRVKSGATMTPGDHNMTFTVSDGCSTTTGTLTIRVNNEPPVITSLAVNNEITISEDLSTETLLHELTVTDDQTVTCSLDSTGVPFLLKTVASGSNYGIFLETGAAMDYYVRSAYNLDLYCDDGFDNTTGVFTVNLIPNKPPVIKLLPIGIDTIEQSVIQTTLHTFSVTDPENMPVTCNYTTDPTTTVIFLKSSPNFNEFEIILQSNPNLNYDVTRTYRVDIQCADTRRNDSSVFYMNVLRNQPPIFTNLQNTTAVSVPSSHIGQLVFDVEATDAEGDQLKYSITCSVTNCPFEIFNSGEILLTRSIKGESVAAYDLYVYVTDKRTVTGPRTLTVQITDINYAPLITNLPLPSALVIPENSALDKSVFQVSTQDHDNTDTHTYSMTSVPSEGMLYFQIDSTTGLVKTSSTTEINYESGASISFNLSITVTDTKDTDTQELSITISDVKEAVFFTKKNYILSLDEGSGGTVLTDPGYLYIDQDTADTHTFGIDCGSGVGYFTIASATGIISLVTDIDVDASGSASSYACVVTISDGTYTDTATMNFDVNNINDNTPVFSSNLYTYYLDISTSLNSVFGSTVATDGDAGDFGTLTYSINQSTLGTETFAIEADGDLYLKNPLTSYGYGQSLKFEVLATDTGGLQGSASVFIVIPQLVTALPTDNDRFITFWEYPANPAWFIVCVVIGMICFILPCYMINKYGGSFTCKGRVGDDITTEKPKPEDKYRQHGQYDLTWKPWKWFETRLK